MNTDQVAVLAHRPLSWLVSPGEHDAIVVSSRIRLARNLSDRAFRSRLDQTAQKELVSFLATELAAVPQLSKHFLWYIQQLSPVERQCLVERHLISLDLAKSETPGAVLVSADERIACMINEEDHLRMQVILPGLDIRAGLNQAVALDCALESRLSFAVHPSLGYLTSCPTNVGTGLRASVMLHLPALSETKEVGKLLRGLSKLSMTARGMYGEGSDALGHFFQISNQQSLGQDEESIADALLEVVTDIIRWERLAREALLADRIALEDKVHRSWGLLSSARRLTSTELTDRLSWVRLGLAMGLLQEPSWSALDRIFTGGQSAHLQLLDLSAQADEQRDRLRAKMVRAALSGGEHFGV